MFCGKGTSQTVEVLVGARATQIPALACVPGPGPWSSSTRPTSTRRCCWTTSSGGIGCVLRTTGTSSGRGVGGRCSRLKYVLAKEKVEKVFPGGGWLSGLGNGKQGQASHGKHSFFKSRPINPNPTQKPGVGMPYCAFVRDISNGECENSRRIGSTS